jgi:MYXO-CTERM domain-containing protein
MACVQADDERFACFVPDEGGCCSASSDPRAPLVLVGLVGLGVLGRRRRRRY